VARFNVDFGGRREEVERDTFRMVAGIQGDFNEDWNYEVSFNYGHADIHQVENNDLHIFEINGDEGPFLLAVDSVRNGAGQIVCRVNADADPSNDRPGCVPFNPFGAGAPSQAALDFVNTTSFVDSKASEYNAVAFLNGDFSQLFEFPGGPARFVIGAEWRRETAFQEADPLSAAGATFFNAFRSSTRRRSRCSKRSASSNCRCFAICRSRMSLTVTGAARWSDYNTSANHTFAYNVSGTWAPVRDIRFRANYSQSVRVPTLGDLYTPPDAKLQFPPGSVRHPVHRPRPEPRRQLRRGAGHPAGFINTLARTQTTEIAFRRQSLPPGRDSKSLTVGVVLTPRWVPGLSVTVDYYAIDLENRIEASAAQTILNQCYDLPDSGNQFCDLVFRNPDSTFASPASFRRASTSRKAWRTASTSRSPIGARSTMAIA
jgi:outer membrane receptor protein involved in Fe transport